METIIVISISNQISNIASVLNLIKQHIITALGRLDYAEESDKISNIVKYDRFIENCEREKLQNYLVKHLDIPEDEWCMCFIDLDEELTNACSMYISAKQCANE